MSVAGLPMYDLPELRPALAAFWRGLAACLEREGLDTVPGKLVQTRRCAALWSDPALLFSQCCGSDLIGDQAGRLQPVATPCYRAAGCDGPYYTSLVVVSENSAARGIEDLRGAVCAINDPGSHSGMSALRALVAPRSSRGRFFGAVRVSGAHHASLAMVARGEADVAAIDCVTHALLARHRPAALEGTRVLSRTAPAPAPPFVTRADAGDDLLGRLRAGLYGAFADPGLAAAREALLLEDIAFLPAATYDDLRRFEAVAVRHGYPELR